MHVARTKFITATLTEHREWMGVLALYNGSRHIGTRVYSVATTEQRKNRIIVIM